jgi:hypothetical protein
VEAALDLAETAAPAGARIAFQGCSLFAAEAASSRNDTRVNIGRYFPQKDRRGCAGSHPPWNRTCGQHADHRQVDATATARRQGGLVPSEGPLAQHRKLK